MTLDTLSIMISVYFLIIIVAVLLTKDSLLNGFIKAIKTDEFEDEKEKEELTAPDWSLDEIKRQLEASVVKKTEPGPDDSVFEFLVNEFCSQVGATIYYANYTKSNVEINGKSFDDWAVQILPPDSSESESKPLEDWDEEYDNSTRFVFRIGMDGENYLVWGLGREDAYLKLYGFLHWFENTYA